MQHINHQPGWPSEIVLDMAKMPYVATGMAETEIGANK